MPTTRRSTGGARARPGPAKGQSTLSFSNKVTKSGSRDDAKDIVSESATKTEPVHEVVSAKEEPPVEEIVNEPESDEDSKAEVKLEEKLPEKSETELKAEKISNAQVSKYWKGIEKERIAPRVHQGDLTLNEKVLRYFDVSSQYGPCVGITRMKRWQRANTLGLNPPIEVLSVLLKEDSKLTPGVETAHMDKILSSTALGP